MWNIKQTYKPAGYLTVGPDIENTEAAVYTNSYGQVEGKITKISGIVGDGLIPLFPPGEQNATFPPPFLGVGMNASATYTCLRITAPNDRAKLMINDEVIFRFESGDALQAKFLVKGHKEGDRKSNVLIITSHQLLQIIETPLLEVELIDNRTGRNSFYYFGGEPTGYYGNAKDGQELFRIMARRIAGTKVMIAKPE